MQKLKYFLIPLMVLSIGFGSIGLASAKNDNKEQGSAGKMWHMFKMPEFVGNKQIHLQENGSGVSVVIERGEVTKVTSASSTDMLEVKIFGQTYKVHAVADVKLVWQSDQDSPKSLADFAVGDIVSVKGKLDAADPLLVHAERIKNLSLQKKQIVLFGEVKSIAAPDSFTMENGKGLFTVITDANTKIFEGGAAKTFADLQVGAKVIVQGMWDRALNKIKAAVVRINPFTL